MTRRSAARASAAALLLSAGCSAPAPSPVPSPAAASAEGAVLGVASEGPLGPFLVDGEGHALYARLPGDGPPARCGADCARVWPPLLAPAAGPAAGDPAVRAELLGTAALRGGARQATYAGRALHRYVGDAGEQGTGQAVEDGWGRWHLMLPSGEPLMRLREPPPPPPR